MCLLYLQIKKPCVPLATLSAQVEELSTVHTSTRALLEVLVYSATLNSVSAVASELPPTHMSYVVGSTVCLSSTL